MGRTFVSLLLALVLILDLVINAAARAKLRARGISVDEVVSALALGPVHRPNPEARVPGGLLAIGPTESARFLTFVLQPDEGSSTTWHLMSAWESSARQIAAYERDS